MKTSIWVGYDARESEAFAVCRRTLRAHASGIPIHAINLNELIECGLYNRPTSKRDTRLWDDISGAHMSTEFAISRFMTPLLAETGLALFMDCDILALRDLWPVFAQIDALPVAERKAIYVVKHQYIATNETKMDGQTQSNYNRKNWSSVMIFNCDHPSNKKLTIDMINTVPGRDLHRFCWLEDEEIGDLSPTMNYLVGVTQGVEDPHLVHFTNGGPWFEGYEGVPFAKEWIAERDAWLAEEAKVIGRPTTWGQAPALALRQRLREVVDAAHLA